MEPRLSRQRLCATCGFLKPLRDFGTGREARTCAGCSLRDYVKWAAASARLTRRYQQPT